MPSLLRCILLILLLNMSLFAAFEHLNTLEGDFKQEIKTLDGEKIIYAGKIYMKKPHFVRWDYTAPTPKELYSDGKQILIFEPLLEQVTLVDIDKEMLHFSQLLRDAKKNKNGQYQATIKDVEYFLSTDKQGLPKTIQYKDEFDNQVIIEFSNCVSNHKIENKIFTFKPPSGIDLDIIRHK